VEIASTYDAELNVVYRTANNWDVTNFTEKMDFRGARENLA
jgi:hypothetical protein